MTDASHDRPAYGRELQINRTELHWVGAIIQTAWHAAKLAVTRLVGIKTAAKQRE
jgi:hypothetical protein